MKPSAQFADLTEGQKACLRLVVDYHTSKEISRILGISPFTVDQRLDAARRKLNAESRKDAARIFASFEATIYDPLIYQPQQLEITEIADKPPLAGMLMGRIVSKLASFISVPPIGGARHSLSTRETLVQSLNIAFFSTLVIATVIVILAGVMNLFA